MDERSLRIAGRLLIAVLLICTATSVTSNLLALAEFEYFPTRYLVELLGSLTFVGCILYIAARGSITSWPLRLLVVVGVLLLALEVHATRETEWPIPLPETQRDSVLGRVLIRPAADLVINSSAVLLVYFYVLAAAQAARTKRRAVELELLQSSLEEERSRLEQRVEQRAEEVTRANRELQAALAENQQALDALRESERRFRSLADNAPVMIWMSDEHQRFTYVNRTWLTATGRALDDELGDGWVKDIHPDDQNRVWAAFSHSFDRRASLRTEFRLHHATGEHRWVLANGQPRFSEEGDLLGYVGSAIDFDDRKREETALEDRQSELERRVASRTDSLQAANRRLHLEVAERQRAENELRAKQRFLEQLLEAHESERQLIAYEVHDGFVQELTGALMLLEAGQNSIRTQAEVGDAQLGRAAEHLRSAIDEGRRLISGLRPPIVDEQGTVAAIEYLIEENRAAESAQVSFQHDVQFDRLSPLIEAVIFRITQEALTNARRHSHASQIEICLQQYGDRLRLTIEDDGEGFDTADRPTRRFGLKGMQERARSVHGELNIDSAPGCGTRVTAELPLVDALQREAQQREQAEVALRESEQRLHAILDNTTAVIYVKDRQGRYELINRQYEHLFDVRRDAFLGCTDYDVFTPERAEAFRRNDQEVLRAGVPVEFEEVVPHQGEIHTYISIKFPLFNADGEPRAVCGVSTDITERKRAEEEVARSRDELESRVEVRTAELVETNRRLEQEVTDRRRAEEDLRQVEQRLRRQMEVLVRLNSNQVFGQGDLDAALRELTETAASTLDCQRINIWLLNEDHTQLGCIEHYELASGAHSRGQVLSASNYPEYFRAVERHRIIAADDALHDPSTREFADDYLKPHGISSMLDAAIRVRGRMVGVVCHEHVGPQRRWSVEEQNFAGSMADYVALALDADELQNARRELEQRVLERTQELESLNSRLSAEIAERRQAEESLRQRQRSIAEIIENVVIGVFNADGKTGMCTYANPTLARLCGQTPEESLGRGWQTTIHPDDRDEAVRHARASTEQASVYDRTFRLLTPQGDVRWVRTWSTIVPGDQQQTTSRLGIVIDLTEQERAKQQSREWESRHRALVDALPDLMFRLDDNDRCLEVRPGAGLLHGLSVDDWRDKPLDALLPTELQHACEAVVHAARQSDTTQVRGVHLAGSDKRYELRARADAAGEVVALLREVPQHAEAVSA